MSKFGIDISRWQGDFDIASAKKNDGIEFVIIKCGGADGGLYEDSYFEKNYEKCEKLGMSKGAYFFGHALSMDEAKKEASFLINLLKGHRFDYPIFYDVEGAMCNLDKRTLTDIVKYICQTVQNAGYWIGIYASHDKFENNVYDAELKPFSHWVASWSVKSVPKLSKGGDTQMWQFGGETNLQRSTKINGQTVDQNYCYIDYPSKIKAFGVNGYSKTSSAQNVATAPTIRVGSKIILKADAVDLNSNVKFASFVYSGTYEVIRLEGNKVVFGKGGAVTGVVDRTMCIVHAE